MFGPEENKMQMNIDWLETYNLALKDVVSCDTPNCENHATDYSKVACCGAVLIFCNTCMHNAIRVATFMVRNGKSVICAHCKSSHDPAGWLSKPEKLSLL